VVKERDDWEELSDGFNRRIYSTYEGYLASQAKKLGDGSEKIAKMDDALRSGLLKRIRSNMIGKIPASGNVLCLGARMGGEVAAFIAAHYFAIGIDINPGKGNTWVLHGDFHKLDFPDHCTEIVFTNSLDHVMDMAKVLAEVKRVLKPSGVFVMEAKGGVDEPEVKSARSDKYDCMEWLTLDGLIAYIEKCGFQAIHRYRFKGFTPNGIIFRKAPRCQETS
jgi:SAM-dependent methyltransferase